MDDSLGTTPYERVDSLAWTQTERKAGKRIKIQGFPKDHEVKLFRVASSNRRTEYVVTNDGAQGDTSVAQQVCHWRWKIEPFHREAKQLTDLERYQCRLVHIVCNHIRCALLVWIRLEQVVYQVKHGLLSDYLRQQLKSPAVRMELA